MWRRRIRRSCWSPPAMTQPPQVLQSAIVGSRGKARRARPSRLTPNWLPSIGAHRPAWKRGRPGPLGAPARATVPRDVRGEGERCSHCPDPKPLPGVVKKRRVGKEIAHRPGHYASLQRWGTKSHHAGNPSHSLEGHLTLRPPQTRTRLCQPRKRRPVHRRQVPAHLPTWRAPC